MWRLHLLLSRAGPRHSLLQGPGSPGPGAGSVVDRGGTGVDGCGLKVSWS